MTSGESGASLLPAGYECQSPPGCDLWGNGDCLLPGAGSPCVSRVILVAGATESNQLLRDVLNNGWWNWESI